MNVLTVVGRAGSLSEFEHTLESYLSEPYKIAAVIPLAEDSEAKRFLAYVDPSSEEVEDGAPEALADFLTEGMYSVQLHENPEDAIHFTHEEYGQEAYSGYNQPITSSEIYQRDVFVALTKCDDIAMVRSRFDGQPAIALVHVANGHGKNDSIATPLAILLNDDLSKRLELPFKSSYDK